MLDFAPLLGFVAVSTIIIVAPGSDSLLLIRASLSGGQRRGFATFAGIHVGNTILTTLVASGLSVIIAHNHPVMVAIQVAGGLYLLWLAWSSARTVRTLLDKRRRQPPSDGGADAPTTSSSETTTTYDPETASEAAPVSNPNSDLRATFNKGLITNLTNPKLMVFYLSFFPQFLGHAHNAFAQTELLALVFIAMSMVWEALIVAAAARMQHLMQHPSFALALDALCAVVFSVMAVAILTEAALG